MKNTKMNNIILILFRKLIPNKALSQLLLLKLKVKSIMIMTITQKNTTNTVMSQMRRKSRLRLNLKILILGRRNFQIHPKQHKQLILIPLILVY